MSKNWGQGAGTWYRHVVQVRVRARGTGTWCRYVYGHMVQARGGSAGHTSPRRAFDSLRICYDENFRRNAGCLRSLPHYTDVSVICFTQADFFFFAMHSFECQCVDYSACRFFARCKVAILLFDRHLCCAADVQVFPYLKWFC